MENITYKNNYIFGYHGEGERRVLEPATRIITAIEETVLLYVSEIIKQTQMYALVVSVGHEQVTG